MEEVGIEEILRMDTDKLKDVDLSKMVESLRAMRAKFEAAEALKEAKKSKKETRTVDEILKENFE